MPPRDRRAYDKRRYAIKRTEILARNADWRAANRDHLHTYYVTHRERILAKNRRWAAANRQDPTTRLRAKNGWSKERFAEHRAAQNDCCAICGEQFVREPAADHNHKTGQPRGILCHHCNVGLGMFLDDPSRLRRAIEYLRTWGTD